MSEFVLKRGDTLPVMENVPILPDGTDYVPASGDVGLLKVYLPTGLFQRTTTTVVGVSFDYAWDEDDWLYLSPGIHRMELEVTLAAGGVLTIPNRRYDKLVVDNDLDGVAAPPIALDGSLMTESGISSKISGLTNGAPGLSTDQIAIARSGVSRRLTLGDIPSGSALADRFLGVEYVFYGAAKAGKPAPTGPEIVLTAAQVRALFSAPQTLIAAVPDRVIIPVRAHIRKEAGAVGFVAGSNTGLKLCLNNGSGQRIGQLATVSRMRFDQTTEEAFLWNHPAFASNSVIVALNMKAETALTTQNVPLVLAGETADMTSDGSPVHISILAELWPVSVS